MGFTSYRLTAPKLELIRNRLSEQSLQVNDESAVEGIILDLDMRQAQRGSIKIVSVFME